ncbi:MAG TPA: hypothetical protein VER55_00175 [Ardenticatenaceae bacterium]|nr:hypothetical protein [Ardenticatenaceae bacterium]
MSRHTDVHAVPYSIEWPPLPIVDWQRVGQSAPRPVPVSYQDPSAPLPHADFVVLTWTSAEWSALDHVFLNSGSTRTKSARDWQRSWYLYSRNAPPPPSDSKTGPFWGYYQLVEIDAAQDQPLRVLLFKSNSHLAHPNWLQGLEDMLGDILQDVQPASIYSIGTAGGTREDVRLGDVAITNSAHIQLQKPDNAGSPINGQSFTCDGWFPATTLLQPAQEQLFFPMNSIVTYPALQNALAQLHGQVPDSANFTLDDLLNDALRPGALASSRALPMPGTPLLTTDYYYIATGADAAQWAVLEMDDAVIAYVAGQQGIRYAFVRNISDPLVPDTTSAGVTIPDEVRDRWSGLIYEDYGFYTSFNGALTTWAAIAAQD